MVKPAIFARVLIAVVSLLSCGQSAQAGLIPWLYDSFFGPSYYPPAFSGYGVSAGYAPYSAGYAPYYDGGYAQTSYYGPGFDSGCGCNPCGCNPCGGCGSCGTGGCASGNCTMNSAPAGTPTPIPDPRGENSRTSPGGYDTTPRRNPAGGTGSGRDTFDNTDPGNFVTPDTTGTGTGTRPRVNDPMVDPIDNSAPPKFKPRSTPADDGFRERTTPGSGSGTGTGRTDPFDTMKPILGNPDDTALPAAKPAGGGAVVEPGEEETPADAAAALEGKTTHRPVVVKQRLALRSQIATPNIARVQVRPTHEWSAAPADARLARQ